MTIFYNSSASFDNLEVSGSTIVSGSLIISGTLNISGSFAGTSSYATNALSSSYSLTSSYVDGVIYNLITVGASGSDNVDFYSIKSAVDSISDAAANNPYLVRVYPGIFIEDTITVKSWVTVRGDSSISTVVSASNPSQSIFIMSDQSMIIDMQIQGATGPNTSAVYYSSPTTPQTNAIAYVENVRFGTNYTNAMCAGSGSGNCILQCSNVKYGGYTDAVSQKSFDIGFRVSGSGGSIGRMQLRNVTSTNGGVAGSDNNQIFALAEAPGCTFIVNGCLLTRATGTARGTGFKVYNGGSLRLTAVNFQRWINGIWAPQTGSAPSIDAVALNFENCTYDVLVEHTGSTGKVSGTDTFVKTIIPADAPLYEVNQDPRRLTVAKKGGDFTSISASVAYITDSSETNRYVINVGPGEYTERAIDLRNKPYVSIVGADIQSTHIMPSGSHDQFLLGNTNEVSFLSLMGNMEPGYAGFVAQDLDGFALIHKISMYDWDYGIKVVSNASSSQFFGEYVDINGPFSYGTYVSSSTGTSSFASMENYYLFPSASATVGNFVVGSGAELDIYSSALTGDNTSGSIAIMLQNGGQLEAAAVDIQGWEYGFKIPNSGSAPTFRMVGSMVHDSITKDFLIEQSATQGRFQGLSDHSKITNNSPDFYWNFLDDNDGENDVTRKLSVTFEDGTHTDATTLIFNGSAMGVQEGGQISIVSGLTASVSGGFGYLEVPNTQIYKRLDWTNTQIILPSSSNSYLYFDSNGSLLSGGTSPSPLTNIIVGRAVTDQTGIAFIDQSPYLGAHTANLISTFNKQALGPVYANGSIVTANTSVSYSLDVTSGNYFFSENQFQPAGGTGITFTRYYRSGSIFNTATTTTIPSNVYNSGSALIAMSASYYTKHTLYVVGQGADEQYMLVVGQNQYATLIQTEDADLPLPPTSFSDGVVSIASIYVQSGSTNTVQVEDIRPVIGFKASGINASSVHGNLLGLSADDHTQYLLVDGAREMAANLGLGGFDIVNVDSITANSITSSFTGSLLGTASYAPQAGNAETIDIFSFASPVESYLLMSNVIATSGVAIGGDADLRYNADTNTLTAPKLSATSITGSLLGTASYASQSLSSSYAFTASYVLNAVSSSFSSTASLAFRASGSLTGSLLGTSSFALTSSTAISSSYALTASFALNAGGASSITIADEGTTQGIATYLDFTGAGVTATVSSNTASIVIPGGSGDTFPYTGSAIISGSLIVTGSNDTFGNLTLTSASSFIDITPQTGSTMGYKIGSNWVVRYDSNGSNLILGNNRTTYPSITTGNNNLFIGNNTFNNAMASGLTSGAGNIGIGFDSSIATLRDLTSGADNIAIGRQAGASISTGGTNIAIGYQSLASLVGTFNNIAIGTSALNKFTQNQAIAIGAGAFQNFVGNGADDDGSVAIGYDAGRNVLNGRHVLIGYQSGKDMSGITSDSNTVVGYNAGMGLRTSIRDTAVGGFAMGRFDTLGETTSNVAIGYGAMQLASSSRYMVAVGYEAGYQNATALGVGSNDGSVYIGYRAGRVTLGNYNVFIGYDAGSTLTVATNTFILANSATDYLITGSFTTKEVDFFGVVNAPSFTGSFTGSYTGSFTGVSSGSFSGSYRGNGSALTGITATAAPAGPNTSIQFNDNGATSGSGNFEFEKTTNSVYLTGSLFLTGSNTAPVQYIWFGTAAGANGTIWTNMPAATASFGNATGVAVSSSHYIGDFTTSTQCRLFTSVTVAGAAAGTSLLVQYSTDNVTWATLSPQLTLGTTLGIKDTGWAALPVASRAFVYIRLVGYTGNGTADPAMSPPILIVR